MEINIPYKENCQDKPKGRNTTIDIVKGTGIILMVWGHAAGPFKHWIYLFHMAVFFIASGVLWDDTCATSLHGCRDFIIRKARSLWLPFVLYNALFNLLHNLFLKTGIYLQKSRTANETMVAILKNLFFAGGSQLGGATWFLRTLFQVLFIYMIIVYISNKLNARKLVVCISIFICITCATIVSIYNLKFPLGIHSFFAAFLVFLAGVFIHNKGLNGKISRHKYKVIIISFLVLCLLNRNCKINMASGNITNVIFLLIASVAGWFMLYSIASCKGIKENRFLVYMGQHTLSILALHFLAFKIVTWIYILVSNRNMLYLSAFPVIKNIPFLWLPYTFCGIAVPLIVNAVFLRCKNIFLKNIIYKENGWLYKYAMFKQKQEK